MTGQLSTYTPSGSDTDQVAKQVRRLIGDGRRSVFEHMTAAQITYVQTRGTSGDSTGHVAAIQAAIDYAYANKIGTVVCPGGCYVIDSTIYLDPPNGLRVSDYTQNAFCLALVSDEEVIANQQVGCWFKTTNNNFVAVQIGPGNGCYVRNIHVVYNAITFPYTASTIPTTGIGFGVSGGYGGASYTLIEKCSVSGFYSAFYLGNNFGALADSTTLIKCQCGLCIQGLAIGSGQAYLVSLYDCRFSAKYGTFTSVFPSVRIFGGSYMRTSFAQACQFPISSVGALSSFTDNTPYYGAGATNFQFNATLTTDSGTYGKYDGASYLDFIYDRWAIKLPSYGFVPITLKAWNSSTKVATFALHYPWVKWFFSKASNITTISDISDEIQAQTQLWGSDHSWCHYGNVLVKGSHIETNSTLTVLRSGGTNDYRSRMEDVYFNYDPTLSDHSIGYAPTSYQYATFAVQQSWPLFECVSQFGGITLDHVRFSQDQSYMQYPIVVDHVIQSNVDNFQMTNADVSAGILYRSDFGYSLNQPELASSPRTGSGLFDRPYFMPNWVRNNTTSGGNMDRGQAGLSNFVGFRPAPYETPRLLPGYVDNMAGTITDYTSNPLIHGDTIYSVGSSYDSSSPKYALARQRDSRGYTYGKDITVSGNWSYKGGTGCVLIPDDNAIKLMFPGLHIILNDGSTDWEYIVMGVVRPLGYIYVFGLNTSNNVTAGSKGVTVSGGTIKQKAYNVKKYGRQCEFGSAAPSSGTWAVGDICYNTAPSSSGYVGWVCTVAGTPGTWKGFGVIA